MKDYRVGYIDADVEPVAVFIDSTDDCGPGRIMFCARMGEHSEADIEWVRQQPLADTARSQPLHAYLERRYSEPPGEPLQLVIDQAAVPR